MKNKETNAQHSAQHGLQYDASGNPYYKNEADFNASLPRTSPALNALQGINFNQSTAPTSVNLSTAVPDYTQQVNSNDKIRKYAFNDLGTTIFKKGGLVKKKQAGGSSESSSSQLGVARKGAKIKPTDRIKKAQAGSKLKYNPNKPYSKINYDGNAYNKDLEGMKKTSIDSLQTYNRSNTNESDSRNAKQLLSDLRSGKSKMPKKETGGKAPMPTRKVALTKASLKKEEKRNAEISKPDNILKPNRIGKAKIDKVKCGKKLKFKK